MAQTGKNSATRNGRRTGSAEGNRGTVPPRSDMSASRAALPMSQADIVVLIVDLHSCHTNTHITVIRKHWIQRITFTAETNAMRVQSRLGGHTHAHNETYTGFSALDSLPRLMRRAIAHAVTAWRRHTHTG